MSNHLTGPTMEATVLQGDGTSKWQASKTIGLYSRVQRLFYRQLNQDHLH